MAIRSGTERKALIYGSLAVVIILLLLASWTALRLIKSRAETDEIDGLKVVLETSKAALQSWSRKNEESALLWGQHREVREAALALLAAPRDTQALLQHPAQRELRDQLNGISRILGYQGFFIVAPDGTNLASSRDGNVGQPSQLLNQQDFLDRIWSGTTAISIPQASLVPLPDGEGDTTDGVPTMFAGAPIIGNDGRVVAAFAFRLDPYRGFLDLLRQGRFARTGETYAIDRSGTLVSESRYETQLREMGLLEPGQHSTFNIRLTDPPDLSSGKITTISTPYPDYRGIPVIGAWHWDDDMGIGLITEIDASEAYASYNAARTIITTLTLFLVALLIIATVVFQRAQGRLELSERRFRGIAENLPGLVFQLRREGPGKYRYEFISGNMAEQIGIDLAEVKEQSEMKGRGTHPDDRQPRIEVLEASAASLTPVDFEFRSNPDVPPERILRMLSVPQRDNDGSIVWDGVCIDVTKQKKAETALKRALDEMELRIAARTSELWRTNQSLKHEVDERKRAERHATESKESAQAASRSKSEFLANMSHDLRTPLNAILGFAQVIKDQMHGPKAIEKYADYANDIYESGALLLEIINDILDLSKLEAGEMELDEGWTEPRLVIEGAVKLIAQRASDQGIKIEFDLNSTDVRLAGDRRKLKQALINLLSNAIKFTPGGNTVTTGCCLADNGDFAIFVRDEGIGIAGEDISRILRPFGQVSNPLTRSSEGTGLGLPIVCAILKLHGGHLEIASKVGEGTEAKMIIPADRVSIDQPKSLKDRAAP